MPEIKILELVHTLVIARPRVMLLNGATFAILEKTNSLCGTVPYNAGCLAFLVPGTKLP